MQTKKIFCRDRCKVYHEVKDMNVYCHKLLIRPIKAKFNTVLHYYEKSYAYTSDYLNSPCKAFATFFEDKIEPFLFPSKDEDGAKCQENMYYQMISHIESTLCDCFVVNKNYIHECTFCEKIACTCEYLCDCGNCMKNWDQGTHDENNNLIPKRIRKIQTTLRKCINCKNQFNSIKQEKNDCYEWSKKTCIQCLYLRGRAFPKVLYKEEEDKIQEMIRLENEEQEKERIKDLKEYEELMLVREKKRQEETKNQKEKEELKRLYNIRFEEEKKELAIQAKKEKIQLNKTLKEQIKTTSFRKLSQKERRRANKEN